jgi:Fe2+ transport system protein FeoA
LRAPEKGVFSNVENDSQFQDREQPGRMTKPVPHRGASNFLRVAELPRLARAVVVAHETDAATAERLSALGLGVGADFTVLQAGASPTVRVGESRIGLGPALAGAVRARPYEP